MKTFDVYQIRPGQHQMHQIECNPHGEMSSAIIVLMMANKLPATALRIAMENNLYMRTWTVRCDDITETFGITNGYPEAQHHEVVMKTHNACSGSVGMVVIERGGSAWCCLSMGWAELPDDLRNLFPSDEDVTPAEV